MVAWAAREEARLDRVIFVPANVSPFKQGHTHAAAILRLRMLRLALAGLDWCTVSELEVLREGVSYSVDTIRAIAAEWPEASLFFVIGADNLADLSQWRDINSIQEMVEFLVIPRPGIEVAAVPPGIQCRSLKGWPLALASSQVRQRVANGLPVEHLVPAAVAEVIRNNQLYLD